MQERARWRDPRLGEAKEVELPQGRLRYYDVGSGPPIVFVHGFFVNANLWRNVAAQLAPDFRCIVLELPFGAHEVPMSPDADLSERGVVELITGAMEKIGVDDVTLVGMDTGGAICQFIVTQRPERIDRLVLFSCDYRDNFPPRIFSYLKLLPYIQPAVPALFAPLRLRALRRLPFAFGWLSKRPIDPAIEDTWSLPTLEDKRVRADVAKASRIFDKRRLNEAADLLPQFERPVLIAWSTEDKVFPTAHARALASDLPNARLEWIDDARTLSMEDNPARVADLIAEFAREPARAAA